MLKNRSAHYKSRDMTSVSVAALHQYVRSKKMCPSTVRGPANNPIRRTDETKSQAGESVTPRLFLSPESASPKEGTALRGTEVVIYFWSTRLPAHTVSSVSSRSAVAVHWLFPIFRISFAFFVLQKTETSLGKWMQQERRLWEHTHCVDLKWLVKWKVRCPTCIPFSLPKGT